MDGAGFHVDLARLDEAAAGITASILDQVRHGLGELPDVDGAAEVREAFRDFCGRWRDGTDVLTEDAARIAETLRQAAAIYRATDEASAGALASDPALAAVDE